MVTPRIEPGTAWKEAWTLPLDCAPPPRPEHSNFLPSSVGQEDEVHGRGGGQIGRAADEHSRAQRREGQEEARDVGSDLAQDALDEKT